MTLDGDSTGNQIRFAYPPVRQNQDEDAAEQIYSFSATPASSYSVRRERPREKVVDRSRFGRGVGGKWNPPDPVAERQLRGKVADVE